VTRFYRAVTLAIALAFNAAMPHAATWTRVASGKYEVLTDGPAKEAERAALTIRQVAGALTRILGPLPASAPPVRVVVFREEKEFRKFSGSAITRGFFQSSAERDYLVLNLSVWLKDRVLKHEMGHLFLVHTTGPLPQWLEEGTAEFFSSLQVGGGKALVGRAIESHVELLNRDRWIPASRLLQVTKADPEFNQEHQAGMFYAESWALVHMLHHHPEYRGRMASLTTAISEGLTSEQALTRIYSQPLARIFDDLRRYVAGRRFAVSELALPALPLGNVDGSALGETATIEALAELYTAVGNPDGAREMYARLVKTTPDNSQDRWSASGFLALREGRTQDAVESFRRSVEAGSPNASVHFELAMLLRGARRSDGEVEPLLKAATKRNPAFAEAWYQLGLLQLRQRDVEGAVESFRNAVKILPRQAPFWDGLARAYAAAGARESAKEAAWRAAEAAESNEQRMSALGLMRELQAARNPEMKRSDDVRTPPSWNRRRGDAAAAGTLVQVDCSGPVLVFVVETGERKLRLVAASPASVQVDGATEARDFPCGGGLKTPVSVEYVESSKELTAIRYQ